MKILYVINTLSESFIDFNTFKELNKLIDIDLLVINYDEKTIMENVYYLPKYKQVEFLSDFFKKNKYKIIETNTKVKLNLILRLAKKYNIDTRIFKTNDKFYNKYVTNYFSEFNIKSKLQYFEQISLFADNYDIENDKEIILTKNKSTKNVFKYIDLLDRKYHVYWLKNKHIENIVNKSKYVDYIDFVNDEEYNKLLEKVDIILNKDNVLEVNKELTLKEKTNILIDKYNRLSHSIDPLISIVIETCNNEDTLDRCLNSVVKDTYQNKEIIIKDNKSKDKTLEIIKKYASKDKRIKISSNYKIKGEYVFYLEPKNFIEKSCIVSLLYNLENTNSDVSICGYNDFIKTKVAHEKKEYIKVYDNKEILKLLNNKKLAISNEHFNKLYKIELLDNKKKDSVANIISKANRIVYSSIPRVNISK